MGKAKAKRRDIIKQNNRLKPKHTRITLNTTRLAFSLKDKLAMLAKTRTDIKDPSSHMPATAEVDRHTERERLAAGSGLRQALGHFRKSGCAGRDLCQWKESVQKKVRAAVSLYSATVRL